MIGNSKFKFPNEKSNFKPKDKLGFTLIELMVAISITAVLGALAIAGFTNYNQSQLLQISGSEVVTMLNLAKSRVQSQVKPTTLCPDDAFHYLEGYRVEISSSSNNYSLYLLCRITDVVPNTINPILVNEQIKKLPSGLAFDADKSITFSVRGGEVSPTQIIISDNSGNARTISINSIGGVDLE